MPTHRTSTRRRAVAGSDHHGGFTKKYLSTMVSRFSGCLSVISNRYADVLTLRTGWGIRRSYGRRAVARILHVSLAREGRLEQRAVTALRAAGKRGSCARAQQRNQSALFMTPSELSLLGRSVPRAFVSLGAPASRGRGRSGRAKHTHPQTAVSGASTGGVPGSIPNLARPTSSSFPWLFIVLGLVAATALASPLARRRRLRPHQAGVPSRAAGMSGRRGAAAAAGAAVAGAATATRRRLRPHGGGTWNAGTAAPEKPPSQPAADTSPAPAEGRGAGAGALGPGVEALGAGALGAGPGVEALGAGALGAGALASERERGRDHRSGDRTAAGDPAAASSLGASLEREGDIEGALAAYRRADAGGDAAGATNLGVLLEQRGDLEGALSAYRRADERGDANGSFNLGCLLADYGDFSGAVAALRRADERGDPAGASNLGVLLEQRGDLEGALSAYRRADERGDANGSFNLGLFLANHGDLDAAQEAYQRASERGDPDVADRARAALAELHDNASPRHGRGSA